MLERVLGLLATTGMGPEVLAMANVAETSGRALETRSRLSPGQQVVIGYDAVGTPVSQRAGPAGLSITTDTADGLSSGLAAGFYPTGSGLYALPTGARVSLHAADAEGRALAQARELVMTRIDGRVTTLVRRMPSLLPETPDLATVALTAEAVEPVFGIGDIETTVLGSVNAGLAVTRVTRRAIPGPIGARFDTLPAEITRGMDGHMKAANATSATATSAGTHAGTAAVLVANIATTRMDVTGRIATVVSGHAAAINSQVTTVLGSVNSGIVGQGD
jgi:hypothetical protein